MPAVRAQLEYLARLQEPGFWENIDLPALEDMTSTSGTTAVTRKAEPQDCGHHQG